VGSLINTLLQIYSRIWQWKKFEHWLRINIWASWTSVLPTTDTLKDTTITPSHWWLSDRAVEAKRVRRRLERRWKSKGNRNDYIAYRQACRIANKEITKARSDFYSSRMRQWTLQKRSPCVVHWRHSTILSALTMHSALSTTVFSPPISGWTPTSFVWIQTKPKRSSLVPLLDKGWNHKSTTSQSPALLFLLQEQ